MSVSRAWPVGEDCPEDQEPTPGFVISGWLGPGEGDDGASWEIWETGEPDLVDLYIWQRGQLNQPIYLRVNIHQANRLGRALANVVGQMLKNRAGEER